MLSYAYIRLHILTYTYMRFNLLSCAYIHAKVTEFANLLHHEFVGTTTRRDPASLSNRLYPAEAGKNKALVCPRNSGTNGSRKK